jgi:hypothetical protein
MFVQFHKREFKSSGMSTDYPDDGGVIFSKTSRSIYVSTRIVIPEDLDLGSKPSRETQISSILKFSIGENVV